MNEATEDQGDKPYEASRRKLEDARKKGEFVRSPDTVTLGSLGLTTGAIVLFFSNWLTDSVRRLAMLTSDAVALSGDLIGEQAAGHVLAIIAPLGIVLFCLPLVVLLGLLVAARQMMFTPDKLKFNLGRISPVSNAKKKYGFSGLFEFAKTVLKFGVFIAIFSYFTANWSTYFNPLILQSQGASWQGFYHVSLLWVVYASSAYIGFAGIDILWQRQSHAKKHRMSHKEMKDEQKNEEGDEFIRHKRRSKAEEIATNRMLLEVPRSSVVITNPTHFAVALKWSGETDSVPECVARGTDEVARKIREIAIESGVPVYRDPPTARELYSTLKIGSVIDRKHYKAVAIAISYARRIERMAAERGL